MNNTLPLENLPAIPTHAEELIALAEKILNCHHNLGTKSPLKVQIIADLNYKFALAKAKHEEAMKYKKLMDEAINECDHLLGLRNPQAGATSISNIICLLAEILQTSEGQEKLANWGFQITKE